MSQQTLKILERNWKAFFQAIKSYKKDPSKFNSKPNLPYYLDKVEGRFMLVYTKQAVNKTNILSKTNIKINTKRDFQEIRIIPKKFGFMIEIVYNKKEESKKDNDNYMFIDLGVNNLVTITSNRSELRPIMVNGRILKSINQYFNKRIKEITSLVKRKFLMKKRYFRIENYFHKTSKLIIDYCLKHNITKIVIGKNDNWKQEVDLGNITNQNFCFLPFNNLINKIKYKSELSGIETILTEESYTSQSSFFDKDVLPTYGKETSKYKFS